MSFRVREIGTHRIICVGLSTHEDAWEIVEQSPKKIDMNRVNAQQARRIFDRLVGFEGSPVVRKQIRGASSVGRVQTVALRLVVIREEQIINFNPEKSLNF